MPGTPAEANIGPSGAISALAVGFGHLVPLDTTLIERRVTSSSGDLTYEFPVAGLVSWLCLKADAIMRRDKPKDAYDVVWLLNALGPKRAAELVVTSPLQAGEFAPEALAQIRRLVTDQFRDVTSVGPVAYAAFLADGEGDNAARDAFRAVAALQKALEKRGMNLET